MGLDSPDLQADCMLIPPAAARIPLSYRHTVIGARQEGLC